MSRSEENRIDQEHDGGPPPIEIGGGPPREPKKSKRKTPKTLRRSRRFQGQNGHHASRPSGRR